MPDRKVIKATKPIEDFKVSRIPKTLNEDEYLVIKLLRPQDLLYLELRFKNFTLSGNQLNKNTGTSLMMVLFQPQSIAETAGTEDAINIVPPALPAKMLMAEESRLVFKIAKDSIGLTAEELLNWNDFELVVSSRAKGNELVMKPIPFPGTISGDLDNTFQQLDKTNLDITQLANRTGITKTDRLVLKSRLFSLDYPVRKTPIVFGTPKAVETIQTKEMAAPAEWESSLEIPFRLFVSPTKGAGWLHESKLKGVTGIIDNTSKLYELWHTRMGARTSYGIDDSNLTAEDRLLRILWGIGANKDPNISGAETFIDPFLGRTSFTDDFRHQLVHESSNYDIKGFRPQPVKTNKLFLTSLGAYLDSSFSINRNKLPTTKKVFTLLEWRHIQTLGREHYVKLVTAGNIMPFGHEAVLLTITERKPTSRIPMAINFSREIIVITQPVKHYNYRDSKEEFMNFCFSTVEVLNPTTPLLDTNKKKLVDPSLMQERDQFIIRSSQKDIAFKMRAEDLNGNVVNFQSTLVFVSTKAVADPSFLNTLIEVYNKGTFVNNRTTFNGQKVSLAPNETNACDTAFAAYGSAFGVQKYQSADELQGFLPNLVTTEIIEPSYQRLTGIGTPVRVSLIDDKKDNKGRVFAKFEFSQPLSFAGNADKTGGFIMPNFNLTGLSKVAGAFGGDLDEFKNAAATAESFFNVNSMPDPVLFGVFKLSKILEFATGDASSYDLSKPLLSRLPKIPNLTTEETEDQIITSYVLHPNVAAYSLAGVVSFNPHKTQNVFTIDTQSILNKKTLIPTFSTTAKLLDFDIALMGDLIKVNFKDIIFTASSGKSPDISVDMENPALKFGGPLSFINAFQQLIPPNGFSDPPYVDVSTTGVKAGYTLALPNLQVGAFTLANLAMAAEVNLPFTGAPMVMGFRFCEKQQPFTLTVAFLGGGGYFGFEADLHGLRQIDAALEFGAAVSLNLGVASGAVSIMAGIYFKMILVNEEGSTQLTGYLRINGAMSILGLITAAIELYMAFTYLISNKAYGEAKVSIKVHVLFFSKTVTVRTSKTFAGSGKDPNFQQTYFPNHWAAYCEAFAAFPS
jgi:hypothetical protein